MEVVMPCCVALLAALSVDGVLSCLGEGTGKLPSASEVRDVAVKAVTGLARSVGELLTDLGIPTERARTRLADELRRLRVRRRAPFAGLDDESALGAVVLVSACMAVLLGVLAWSPLGVLIGFCIPIAALWLHASRRERSTRDKAAESMPEAFEALSISLESGLSLQQAMHYVGGHSEEPVRSEFMRASFAMSCGVPAAEALDEMVGRLSAPGLELVALALKISKRTGAPLKDLLAEASQLAGERIELSRQLDVKTSQARMSAQLVAAMPVAMVALLSLLSSDFRAGLATTAGALSVAVALLLNVVAWLIIRKIMKVEL